MSAGGAGSCQRYPTRPNSSHVVPKQLSRSAVSRNWATTARLDPEKLQLGGFAVAGWCVSLQRTVHIVRYGKGHSHTPSAIFGPPARVLYKVDMRPRWTCVVGRHAVPFPRLAHLEELMRSLNLY